MRNLLCTAVLALAAALPAGLAMADPVVLKLAFFGPAAEVNYARVIKPWVDAVNADAGQAVRIEAYPDGALGKGLPAQPQLILDGVVDIAFVNPSLASGRFPDDQVLELPGLFKDLPQAVTVYRQLLADKALRGYEDYVVLGSMMNPNYNIVSRSKIDSFADLKGQKVRIVGPIIGQTVMALGMVPVMMPPTEIVEAMGRGTVDAATLVPAAIVDFGVDRVAENNYLIPLGNGPLTLLMNRAKYEALPADARETLDRYGIDWVNDLYLKELGSYNEELIAGFKADPKRHVAAPGEAEAAELAGIYEGVITEWSAKAPENAALLERTRAIIAALPQ
ncbi:TRAP transporter substrate-binding protein DctP [Paracoccus sp. 22332]|uniref:TRAP transporter substrate-binding protein DctP n=1 Tax=Paracoccus sp. 22332 TaxID=3453913 RepID=UPI003F86605A